MDLLDRLHEKLLAANVVPPSEDGSRPHLTIADLYQRLIPYRLVRGEAGVMELAEYEHALLRLLAGERRYVELEQAAVMTEFRRELASPHPILGIYRDYANVEVRVLAPSAAIAPAVEPVPPAAPPPSSESVSIAPASSARQPRCRACERILPDHSEMLFCPYCGTALGPSSCAHCGATLEEGWDYCVRCGSSRRVQPCAL